MLAIIEFYAIVRAKFSILCASSTQFSVERLYFSIFLILSYGYLGYQERDMKIIVISKRHGRTRSVTFGGWTKTLISACLVGIPVGIAAWNFGQDSQESILEEKKLAWEKALTDQQSQIDDVKREAEQNVTALTLRLAELQARLVRVDALGERLTTLAKLENGEFDFSHRPALGGPEIELDSQAQSFDSFQTTLEQLGAQIEDRQHQLETLEALLVDRKIQDEVFVAGRPIKKGWLSSHFGRRNDPFTGRIAWHEGVDFAGKEGADIIAVAAGVVTWSDERYGYGNLVEVNHGNGFVTRYAHCKKNLVKVGDVVKKGQVIALMGSTGRSTGPHVHFEVYKHGRAVDPASYIHRASR